MFQPLRRPLAIALTAALGVLTIAPLVHANPQSSMREERAKRRAELGKEKPADAQAEKKPPQYPMRPGNRPRPRHLLS